MGSDISKLVEAINRVGIQNVSLLSRLTGMPKETIRYVLKKRFPELGLSVGMLVDYGKLGLERYFTMLQFSSGNIDQVSLSLERLAKVAFLTYRSGLAFEPWHVAMFAVPVSLSDEFHAFLKKMIQVGVLKSAKIERLEWTRHPELKSRYHDFNSRTWTIDWNGIMTKDDHPPSTPATDEPSPRPDLDIVDTLVIKELEMDSWRNFAEIARKLGINETTLRWHFRNHVSPIISSYYVRWLPVASHELTKVIGLVCEFNDLSRYRLAKIRHLFNIFPFTWYEGGRSDGYYHTHSAIPAEHLIDSLRFLRSKLKEIVPEWKTYPLDISTSWWYTIPFENFKKDEGWFFNQKNALDSVLLARATTKNKVIGP